MPSDPMERSPSLPALKSAVAAMRVGARKITNDMDMVSVRLRLLTEQLDILVECVDILLGDTQSCQEIRFPELNHHDEE